MLRNYINTSFRNLKNRLPYTLINVIGLSVGLSCFLILIAYTKYEENYDGFHENKDQIYRVIFERYQGEQLLSLSPASMPALGNTVKNEIPEIKELTRFSNEGGGSIVKSDRITAEEEALFYADSDFFKMFSFELLSGNPNTALENPNSIVITKSMALKYFGDDNALNKELVVANEFGSATYNVTGISKDLPLNTDLKFNFLASFSSVFRGEKWFENSWMYWAFPTYVRISDNATMERVKKQLPAYIEKYKKDPVEADVTWKFSFQPLKDIHLKSDFRTDSMEQYTRFRTLNLLKIIGFLILLMSWVNYINLSTASSTERAKEIGIRKSLGANKNQISLQYLIEAGLVNGMAVLLSIAIVFLAIKPFSNLLGLNYSTEILLRPTFWASLFPIVVIGTIASGLYPAFVLASFKPTEVLKSKKINTVGNTSVRKILVGIQFVISILLVACTSIMIHQNNYMKAKDLGVDINDVIVMKKPQLPGKQEYQSRLNSFSNELRKATKAKYISASFGVPSIGTWGLAVWKSSEDTKTQKIHMVNGVDANYLITYDLKLLAGRNFEENRVADENTVIISKESMKILGIENPNDAIGVKLEMESFNDRIFEIIGVIDDYHHNSVHNKIGGVLLIPNTGIYSAPRYFSMKLENTESFNTTMNNAKKVYNQFFPGDLFDYFILKDKFQRQYIDDDRNQSVFTLFSFLAILLAYIGILGLSSFIAFLKIRDIAIHKVLGADRFVILWILAKEFLTVLIVASLIAIPIAIYVMKDWLNDFPYRISLNFWHFSLAFFSVFLITLLVIVYNTHKSLRKKPMDILNAE